MSGAYANFSSTSTSNERTFLQIIQAEENLKLAKSQNEITKNQLERAQILFKSGATNQSTVLNLQAQSANDKVNIINAENAIQIGYNTLMNLMQYPLILFNLKNSKSFMMMTNR